LLALWTASNVFVDIKRDPFRDLPEGLAIKIDNGAAHGQQGASVEQILQTGNGRLQTQLTVGSRQALCYLEYGIAAKIGGSLPSS
jgi:hypothetical protein